MSEKLEQKIECMWLEIAVQQRKNEVDRGLDHTGTLSFENRGCYDCSGENYECKNFVGKLLTKTIWYNATLKENQRVEY